MSLETVGFTTGLVGGFRESWYAVQTRSRHEKFAHQHLLLRGVSTYLPTVIETHAWSDRHQKVDVPLFPGYVFVRILAHNEWRATVLRTPGVVRFVGYTPEGSAIPEEQIASVRTIVEQNMGWSLHPFLKVGQRVRVRGGALDGMEGIFVRRNGDDTLIVSVDAIQRSMAVSIRGYEIEIC